MNEEMILELVNTQVQFRFLHWQTKSYAKHQAYGGFYDSLDDLIDRFVEVCMGKHGRPDYEGGFTMEFEDIKGFSMQEYLDDFTEFLMSLSEKLTQGEDTDLLNIRDEILAEVNKLKYLLTLD